MKKNFEYIRALLTKFYDAETSFEEEELLADFFSRNTNLPEDLKADKSVFDSLRSGFEDVKTPENLDEKIMAAIDSDLNIRRHESECQRNKRLTWKIVSALTAAAAVIAIVIMVPGTSDLISEDTHEGQLAAVTSSDTARMIQEEAANSICEDPKGIKMAKPNMEDVNDMKEPAKANHNPQNGFSYKNEKHPTEEDHISEEELKALHEGLSMLAKAGRKIAYAKERINDTEQTVCNSIEEISGILNK